MRKTLMYLFLIAGSAVCIGYRYFQLTHIIDPVTGFINQSVSDNSSFVIIGIVAIMMISLLILSALDDQMPKQPLEESVTLGSLSILYSAVGFYFTYQTYQFSADKLNIILAILSFASNVLILSYGISLIFGSKKIKSAFVLPAIFAGFRLAVIFLKYFGLAKTSDVILEIITLIILMVFWQVFGKFNVKSQSKISKNWTFGIGLCASLMCFITTVPVLYATYFTEAGEKGVRHLSNFQYFDFATGLYILAFIICTFSFKRKSLNED